MATMCDMFSGTAPGSCCPVCFWFWELPPILGGALRGTAVRLALIVMAAAGLASILLVIARKALGRVWP